MSDLVGRRVGPYELVSVLRRGRFATRYRGAAGNRPVVVTVYEREPDDEMLRTLRREVEAVAGLRHPHVVAIRDLGEDDRRVYLVEDFFGSHLTLADRLPATMDAAGAVGIISSVLAGLGHAHEHAVVHGSVTPRHIVLAPPIRPVLVDFAVGREAGGRLSEPGTGARLVAGHPAYLSPEQAYGLPADVRSDLYATGVVLYEMLTGRVPFEADDPAAVLRGHASEPPVPLRQQRPDLRPELEAVVLTALAKDPAGRPQSALELKEQLADALRAHELPTDPLAADYESGLRAFSRGEWAAAVERLARVAEADPDYEDVEDLLRAAEDAAGTTS